MWTWKALFKEKEHKEKEELAKLERKKERMRK